MSPQVIFSSGSTSLFSFFMLQVGHSGHSLILFLCDSLPVMPAQQKVTKDCYQRVTLYVTRIELTANHILEIIFTRAVPQPHLS